MGCGLDTERLMWIRHRAAVDTDTDVEEERMLS